MFGKLTKLLECPICFNTLTVPVALCRENGHAICGTCQRSVNSCPYCKSQWSQHRHILLEQLLQALLHQCSYCRKFVYFAIKDEHENKLCLKKVMQCFIHSRGSRCQFFFPKELLWKHLYEKHSRKIWKIYLNETVTVPIKNVFFTKNFCVLFKVGFQTPKRAELLVVLRVFGDKDRRLLCFSVNILDGDEEGNEQYIFRFGIRQKNTKTTSFVGPCIPLSGLPEKPDRFPGGHPNNRIVLSKSHHIFNDPYEQSYYFELKITKP